MNVFKFTQFIANYYDLFPFNLELPPLILKVSYYRSFFETVLHKCKSAYPTLSNHDYSKTDDIIDVHMR